LPATSCRESVEDIVHEIGIAASILEAIRSEAALRRRVRPVRAGVRIGELAGVDAEALRFCFETLVIDTDLAHLKLEIEICVRRHRCCACQKEFSVSDYDFRCPACGRDTTEFISGDQLEFAYLEVEEYESATA
jgi:hydrogenase nickel incorporation protein HypA/HybF